MKPWTILLDVDGVLGNFVSRVLHLPSINRPDLLLPGRWPKGQYPIEPLIGVTTPELWEHIDGAGVEFWSQMEPYPWAWPLADQLRQFGDVHLLTMPSASPDSHAGKKLWIDRIFGHGRQPYTLTSHKHLFAGPHRLLIDDFDRNCEEFDRHGGQSIIFPQPWNHGHPVDDVLDYIIGEVARITAQ